MSLACNFVENKFCGNGATLGGAKQPDSHGDTHSCRRTITKPSIEPGRTAWSLAEVSVPNHQNSEHYSYGVIKSHLPKQPCSAATFTIRHKKSMHKVRRCVMDNLVGFLFFSVLLITECLTKREIKGTRRLCLGLCYRQVLPLMQHRLKLKYQKNSTSFPFTTPFAPRSAPPKQTSKTHTHPLQ